MEDEKALPCVVPNLMRVPIIIHKRSTLALIDCGSAASLLPLAVFIDLPNNHRKPVVQEINHDIYFKTISGELMQSLGLYNIKFRIETNPPCIFSHPFYIIKSMNEGAVLGHDFLSKYKLVLFPRNKAIGYLNDNQFKILRLNALEVCSIKIDKFPIVLNVPDKYRQDVEKLLEEIPNLYATKLSEIGAAKGVEFEIKTTGKPVKQKVRKIPYAYLPQVKAQIAEMLECGIITKSISNYASPIHCVRKKDSTIRMCVDYRLLNKQVVDDTWPIPNIETLIDSLEGATIYTQLDMFSGYNQIIIKPEDRHKTCFLVPNMGAFEYTRIPFGLSSAPSFFSRVVHTALEPLLYRGVICYLDDCLAYGRTETEHKNNLEITLRLLHNAGFKLKLSKCFWYQKEIEFLGFKISGKGVEMSESKIKPLLEMGRPKTPRQIKVLTGYYNYYRKWIKNYASIAAPLYELTKKNVPFVWGEKQEESFLALRNCIINGPCLRLPIMSRQFYIMVDASGTGCGAVLTQYHPKIKKSSDLENTEEKEEDEEVPIAFASKKFNDAQKKLSSCEAEFLAVLFGVESFRKYVLGRKFYVLSDCVALKSMMEKPEPKTPMLRRWAHKLSEYNMTILYRPGKESANVDALSRIPVNSLCIEYDISDWVIAQQNDEYCRQAFKELTEGKDIKKGIEKYKILNQGLLATKDGRVLVPESKRTEVLRTAHESKMRGAHLGIAKVTDSIRKRYVWPYLAIDVINHVNNCMTCNKRKALGENKAPLTSMPATSKVFKMLCTDIIEVPECQKGYNLILNVMDYATRFVISMPLRDQTAKTVVGKLIKKVFTIFGFPSLLLSDNGPCFSSELLKETCEAFGIKKIYSTSFHSIGDGLIERYQRVCNEMVASYCNKCPDKWDEVLGYVTLAYNCSKQASTKFTPFELFMGRQVILPDDLGPAIRYRSVDKQKDVISLQWSLALEAAKDNLLQAQFIQRENYDKDTKITLYAPNDKVLLKIPPQSRRKYSLRWEGLYTVIRQTSESNYEIKNDKTGKVFLVHSNRLKRLRGDPTITVANELENKQSEGTGFIEKPPAKRGRPPKNNTVNAKELEKEKEKEWRPPLNRSNPIQEKRRPGRPRKTIESRFVNKDNSARINDSKSTDDELTQPVRIIENENEKRRPGRTREKIETKIDNRNRIAHQHRIIERYNLRQNTKQTKR